MLVRLVLLYACVPVVVLGAVRLHDHDRCNSAQDAIVFPTRTVQIVVPYTPGTTPDILARLLGPKLSERWKVGVITDNRPGATGSIGIAFVAKAAPDGHTLLFVPTSFSMITALYPKLAFDPVKSFAPVALIATGTLALVVHPQLPARSVREFVQLAKRRPGELHYASPGNASAQHLAMELFKSLAGVNVDAGCLQKTSGVLARGSGGLRVKGWFGHRHRIMEKLQNAD